MNAIAGCAMTEAQRVLNRIAQRLLDEAVAEKVAEIEKHQRRGLAIAAELYEEFGIKPPDSLPGSDLDAIDNSSDQRPSLRKVESLPVRDGDGEREVEAA